MDETTRRDIAAAIQTAVQEQVQAVEAAAVQRHQALESQVAALQASLLNAQQELQTVQQTGLGSLPALVQQVTAVVQTLNANGAARETGQQGVPMLIDQRGIGRPDVFKDVQDKFAAWARKTENFVVGSFGESLSQVLTWAVDSDTEITEAALMDEFGPQGDSAEVENVTSKSNQLYTALVSLTDENSNDLVVGSGAGDGVEAWRRLHRRWDPSTGGRKRALLKGIIAPPRCKLEELGGCLERWVQQTAKYERRKDVNGSREIISQHVKLAALEMLVPEELENHLMLNKH